MSDLRGWTGPVPVSGFQFREPLPPMTTAERLARMSDEELREHARGLALGALDRWETLDERGRRLVRRVAEGVGLDVPAE